MASTVSNLPWSFAAFDADSAWLPAAAGVYTAAYGASLEPTISFFQEQARRPDFYGLVAATPDQQVIATGFGTRTEPGQWWHNLVAQHVGADHPAIQDAWVLVELVVLSAFRGQGCGSQILQRLLAAQPHPRAVLSVVTGNTRARTFYERLGWRYLHPGIAFSNGKTYAIMHTDLPSV